MFRNPEVDLHLDELFKQVMDKQSHYIEMMAAAYFKETDIPASEVELVQCMDGYKITWYFQRRQHVA